MPLGDKVYRLVHPDSADALIDEEEFDLDERLPYWAVIWPSAITLSRYILGRDLSGKRVIELGCGVGLPSAVALDRGAEVTATDHYQAALEFTRHNAWINTERDLTVAHLDWHSAAANDLGKFDLVLAADVLYEQRNVPTLAALIPDLLAPNGKALISNPCRRDTPDFHEIIQAKGFSHDTHSATARQGEREIEVLMHEFRRGA